MPTIASLTSFTANTQAKAAEVNANFSSIRTTVNTYAAFVDASATITGAWTFSTAPVFTNAQTFAAAVTITTGGLTVTAGGLTVTAGGITATGNSTITGTLGGLTGVTVTGTVTATTFSGSGASLTSIPASAIGSGVLDSARLPSTFSNATTFSAGGEAVTVSNSGRIVFSGTGSGTRHLMDIPNPYIVDGNTTVSASALGFGEPLGSSGSTYRWDWVKVMNNNSPDVCWIPLYVRLP
jgi:hypothetical protein